MTTDHTPAEAGVDRQDTFSRATAERVRTALAERPLDDAALDHDVRVLVSEVLAPSVVPGDTATEAGDGDFVAANEALGEALTEIGMVLGLPKPRSGATWGAAEVLEVARADRAAREEISRLLATAGTAPDPHYPGWPPDAELEGTFRERIQSVIEEVQEEQGSPGASDLAEAVMDEFGLAGGGWVTVRTPRHPHFLDLVATAGTEGEAEHPAVRALREALGYAGDDWPLVSSHITDRLEVVKETVASLEPWPVRAASPQGEAQGQGEEVWNGNTWFVPAAPRAVAPVGNVDRETLRQRLVRSFRECTDEPYHMADVALAALRGENQ